MPGKRKAFIEKKNAVTYRLVPRCQLDPDGDTSEHVLVPVNESKAEKFSMKLPEAALPPSAKEIPSFKKQLPVKGPQPDWDPDIVAALDDDFNYEESSNVLEDDFIAKANGPTGELPPSDDDSKSDSEKDCDSNDEENGSLFGYDDDDNAEGKARFTQYSLTSAVTNCTEEVQTFNERFEKLCEAYDEDQIGALDFEDIEGYLSPNSKIVKGLVEDFEKHKKKLYLDDNCLDEHMKNKILHYAQMSGNEKLVKIVIELPLEYDCESILSTYSDKYNRPALIKVNDEEKPTKISTRLWKQKLTKSSLKQLEPPKAPVMKQEDEESYDSENNETMVSLLNFRPRNESSEEKKFRKQAVKQMKKENRKLKKENKLIAKKEAQRIAAVSLNSKKNQYVHLN